ncbi:DUF5399 family protein [Rhabdochlamydiaceae symbiont of Dictyostelium giganteum]|uniref:DUF5399 family protein n=1 Tax=Rhabdochlamydiaceae symbiont of Dictyostelium giganteum TaxID=3342349 RepID=UPI0038507AF9
MTDPKTVANLPLDVSIRWAEDQQLLQESRPIIQDSQFASSHAQFDTAFPSKQAEVVALFDLFKLHPSWATFKMPPDFTNLRRRIFRSKLASFIGTEEQQETVMARLLDAVGDEEDQPVWEEEKNNLIQVLNLLHQLNKDLLDITSRCKQYQKG